MNQDISIHSDTQTVNTMVEVAKGATDFSGDFKANMLLLLLHIAGVSASFHYRPK